MVLTTVTAVSDDAPKVLGEDENIPADAVH